MQLTPKGFVPNTASLDAVPSALQPLLQSAPSQPPPPPPRMLPPTAAPAPLRSAIPKCTAGSKPKTAAPPEPDELARRLDEKEAQLGCAADKLER